MKGRNEADFSHSMTDLMSGVAVMFLLIAAIFMVQASKSKKIAEANAAQAKLAAQANEKAKKDLDNLKAIDTSGIDALRSLRDQLGDQVRSGSIKLAYDPTVDPRLLTIEFEDKALTFASNECVIDRARIPTLHSTLQVIFPKICEIDRKLVQSITLEGHTDNLPPAENKCGTPDRLGCGVKQSDECKQQGFENNVRLSAQRAQNVFFEARKALPTENLRCLDDTFLIAGRGPMATTNGKPWYEPQTEAEREKNRRVVIQVRVVAPKSTAAAPP